VERRSRRNKRRSEGQRCECDVQGPAHRECGGDEESERSDRWAEQPPVRDPGRGDKRRERRHRERCERAVGRVE
jgi:hypothetical protein